MQGNNMRKFIFVLVFIICTVAMAVEPYRIFLSFSAGELYLLSTREDLAKYQSGCSVMENMIPMPQGGAQKRPGTKYVATAKDSTAVRLLPFQYSTEQSYVIEAGNQYMRFFADNAAVLHGVGTETLTAVDEGDLVAHWLLNEIEGVTVVNNDAAGTYDGIATVNIATLHKTGNVGTGCFDLDDQYCVEIAHNAAFSFTNNLNDSAFSLACWAYVTEFGGEVLLSKWQDSATSSEWRLSVGSDLRMGLFLADSSANISGYRVAQWKLNEAAANTEVHDDTTAGAYPTPHDGVSTANTSTLTATGLTNMTPCFNFDGQYAVEIADADALSFGNGSTDSRFSIAAWVYNDGSGIGQVILSKQDYTTSVEAREWQLHLNEEKLVFTLVDEDTNAIQAEYANAGISGGWHFVVATYSGIGGDDATEGINLYVDGDIIASSPYDVGNYTSMVNTTTKVVIGAYYNYAGTLSGYFRNKIDNVILFNIELSAAQVTALYNDGGGLEDLIASNAIVYAVTDTALTSGWHFLCSTYSAPADETTAASGIILYVDGVAVASTATNNSTYTAMQGGGEEIRIGAQRAAGDTANDVFWLDKIDEVSIFKDVLTPSEVASLYSTAPYEIETPYLTADLFELKYEQSADVLYITHPDYETRKLSRIANAIWELNEFGDSDGPFMTQNADVADFIAASATTGLVTLTATGCTPFAIGTTTGHEPSGSAATSKSKTGALFRLVHPLDTLSYSDTLEDDYTASQTEGVSWTDCGTLYKGAGWKVTTGGTWYGTFAVQRNYTIGATHGADGWETIYQFQSETTARNTATTLRTEDDGDADYRMIYLDDTAAGTIEVYFETDQTEVVGIVEITSVTSSTSAIGTVIKTLASTNATHKWSEGAWGNYRGWPQTFAFFEDRLRFGGILPSRTLSGAL